MTSVVNLKKEPYDIYIGRGSPFGNPYRIGRDGTREEVLEKYKAYFHKRLLTDSRFRDKVLKLKGKRLGCWCVPDICHGTVIANYLNEID